MGGTARHVLDLALVLSRRGYNVSLIYSKQRADGFFYEELKHLEHLGVAIYQIPMRREIGFWDIVHLITLRKLLLKKQFDVVHAHSSKAGALTRIAMLGLKGLVEYTPHAIITLNTQLSVISRFFYKNVEKFLSFFTDAVIALSDVELEHLIRDVGINPKKIFLVSNGIDLNHILDQKKVLQKSLEIRQSLGIEKDAFVIGFVGRLTVQKSPDILIESFNYILQRTDNVKLIIVGDGELADELNTLIKKYNLGSNVVWLKQKRGVEYMPVFNLFLLTSLYEGFPYVFLEALSFGLPIVSSLVGGASEVIENGKNGYIVSSQDASVIGENIIKIINDAELCQSMKYFAKQKVMEFSIEKMTDKILNVYTVNE